MKQSRFMSLVESIANVAIGFCVQLSAQWAALAFFKIAIRIDQLLAMSIFLTFVSVARGYTLRRLFEHFRRV